MFDHIETVIKQVRDRIFVQQDTQYCLLFWPMERNYLKFLFSQNISKLHWKSTKEQNMDGIMKPSYEIFWDPFIGLSAILGI